MTKNKATDFDFHGGEVLLLDKPLGWTSFDVVNKVRHTIRRATGHKCKVGHGGTLDPLATGLMILATGKKTKQLQELTVLDKTYEATFQIGVETPSYDLETEVSKSYDISHITEAMIQEVKAQFIGEIEQIPPIYSAVKKGGKRLYTYARKGEEVEPDPRKVTIHEFAILSVELPEVRVRVTCSKGTYIRSLAFDFGRALNAGACLSQLRRTAIGDYRIESAWSIERFVEIVLPKA